MEKMATITVNNLAAALMCAAKKNVRFYLVGVNVRIGDDRRVFVESATGPIAFRAVETQLGEVGATNVIIPRSAAEMVVKSARACKLGAADLYRDGDRCEMAGIVFTPVDGAFPDLDRVVPDTPADPGKIPSKMPQYNPALLKIAHDAMCLATGGKRFGLTASDDGTGPGMYNPDDARYPLALVMPWRS